MTRPKELARTRNRVKVLRAALDELGRADLLAVDEQMRHADPTYARMLNMARDDAVSAARSLHKHLGWVEASF